ncbi:MAG: hypothetical protein V3V03_09455 [Hyphomonadaceae bacterium]
MKRIIFTLGVLLAPMLSACVSARPATPLAADTLVYSDNLARARQEQLLLNIVKLRYNDPVSFIEVDKLTTTDTTVVSGGLGSALGLDDGPFTEVLSGNVGTSRVHSPQIVYNALKGEAYATQLLRPLSAASVFLMSQSGWSVERLLLCCIARIGDVENARAAAGPTPTELPDNSEYRALAAHLRALQQTSGLIVQVVEGEGEDDDATPQVVMKWRVDTEAGRAAADLFTQHRIGKLEPLSNNRVMAVISASGDEIGDFSVRGRSLLGILSALSQTVRVPTEHAALTVQTRDDRALTERMARNDTAHACRAAGPWPRVIGDYFAVNSSKDRPDSAAVAVPYRGYWFYVDDRCRSAKATLDLIGHLYALQAGVSGADGSQSIFLLGGG